MLDDPTAPAIYRVSGDAPYPVPYGPLPPDIAPKQVILRDRVTIATLVPFSSPAQVPPQLTAYLCELLGREIEKGDTYPMMEPLPQSSFGPYWFANFGAIMVMGDVQSTEEITEMENRGADWSKECLGSFYIKPNYPGRSSHVCNGGFLVTDAARNRGVGRLMGEGYLEWAPKLGYTYSVFNLVYESNVASLRIWDALGFKRIGRVKGCGNLKSYPDQLIDAIIFGRELGGEGDEMVSEERFDKIKYYLKTGTYPPGSDRAEKSRLRSAATHYRLVPAPEGSPDDEDDKLMLKGKEVVSDPNKQYDIARGIHMSGHGGINKTTATIAEKYHWVRIKETVSQAIRNCPECKDTNAPKPQATSRRSGARESSGNGSGSGNGNGNNSNRRVVAAGSSPDPNDSARAGASSQEYPQQHLSVMQQHAPPAQMQYQHYPDLPVDPQIMAGIHHWETPGDYQAQPHEQTRHHLPHTHQSSDSMHLDDMKDDDVSHRLREELEAQMMRRDPQYTRDAGDGGPG